jgi:hypothetical protein
VIGDPPPRPRGAGRGHRAGGWRRRNIAPRRFEAAEFLMDYLKTRAPFWKSEERAGNRHWVDAQAHDDNAAARWER